MRSTLNTGLLVEATPCSRDTILPIRVASLVITGTEDLSVPAANSEKILGSWLVEIKGGGLGLMYLYPEQVSKIVKTFLEITWESRWVEVTFKQYGKHQ